jgi:hypothetical protein
MCFAAPAVSVSCEIPRFGCHSYVGLARVTEVIVYTCARHEEGVVGEDEACQQADGLREAQCPPDPLPRKALRDDYLMNEFACTVCSYPVNESCSALLLKLCFLWALCTRREGYAARVPRCNARAARARPY